MKSIYEQTKELLNREDCPPLCTDCANFSASLTRETEKGKCLAPQNFRGISLVDGSTQYKEYYACYHRGGVLQNSCGKEGSWFIKKEDIKHPLPVYEASAITNIKEAAQARIAKWGKKIDANKLDNL